MRIKIIVWVFLFLALAGYSQAQTIFNQLFGKGLPSSVFLKSNDTCIIASVYIFPSGIQGVVIDVISATSGAKISSFNISDSVSRYLTFDNTFHLRNDGLYFYTVSVQGGLGLNWLAQVRNDCLDTAAMKGHLSPTADLILKSFTLLQDSSYLTVAEFLDTPSNNTNIAFYRFWMDGRTRLLSKHAYKDMHVKCNYVRKINTNRFVAVGKYFDYFHSNRVDSTNFVMVIDSLGKTIWQKRFTWDSGLPGGGREGQGCVYADSDSTFFVAYLEAVSGTNFAYDNRIRLRKFDVHGKQLLNKLTGPKSALTFDPRSMVKMTNGGILITGQTFGYNTFIFRLNAKGDSLWYKEYRADTLNGHRNDQSQLTQCIAMPDDGALCVGQFRFNPGKLFAQAGDSAWVIRLDRWGNTCQTLGCVSVGLKPWEEKRNTLSVRYGDGFWYVLADAEIARYEIIDLNGKLISTGRPNQTSFYINQRSRLAQGVYLLRCTDHSGRQYFNKVWTRN